MFHHYVWHWTYTVEALVVVLALFLLCSVALLISSSISNRRRHTRRVVHTPHGDVDLNRMSMRGIERARSRQYHVKGREE